MNELIKQFRRVTPKNNWRGNRDIYEMQGDLLIVYGENGQFYTFKYESENDWVKTEYPRDIYGRRIWRGFGGGWKEV